MNCVAFGDISFLYPFSRVTTDGGNTWAMTMHERPSDDFKKYPPAFQDLAYPDTSLCIAVGDSGWYWRSTDKGLTFKKMRMDSIIDPPRSIIRNISMYNNKIGGIIYVAERLLFLTTDGGLTWDKINVKIHDSAEYSSFQDIFFINETTLCILGYYKINSIGKDYVYITKDFGKTWVVGTNFPQKKRPISIYFFNENEGFAVGAEQSEPFSPYSRDIIFYTSDAGMSWEIRLDTMPKKLNGLHEIHFTDRQHGLALGMYYNLWRTSDGGVTWVKDTTYTYQNMGEDLYSIAYIHPGLFYGAGYNYGKIVKWTDPSYTSIGSPIESNSGLEAYPNPASYYLNINLRDLGGAPDYFEIYDIFGRVLKRVEPKQFSEIESIDVSDLSSGLYFLRATGKGLNSVKKFTIAK